MKVYPGTGPLTGREIRFRKTRKTEQAAQIELGDGRQRTSPRQVEGHGLWMVTRACDLVELRTGFAGTSVRVYYNLV